MPTFQFEANGEKFDGGDKPGENVSVTGPVLQTGSDGKGFFASRPTFAQLILTRDLPAGTGDFVLLRTAIASRVWNNRDRQNDKWPKASVVYDKREGNKDIPVQQCDLQRLVVSHWSLMWTGDGPSKQAGIAFTETLSVQAYRLTRKSLVGQPETVEITLA